MTNDSKSLKVDTTVRGIILLTIPISLARLIPELNFLFNSIFLGHLGTIELAYAALTGVYYLIYAAIGYGLSNAILSMISRQAGEDHRDRIINTLRHGYLLGIILFFIALLFTLFGLSPLLHSLHLKNEDAIEIARFMNIRILGLLFLYGFQLSNSYLICIGETRWLIVTSGVEAISNIILDYVLIFGGFGIEPMGFIGAAWASVFSEIIGLLVVGLVIRMNKFSIKYDLPTFWKLSPKLLWKIVKLSSPLMGQYALSIIAWWLFYLMINRNYPYEHQAASQAMRNIFGLSGVFSWSFGASTNTIISNLIGQGKYAEIKPTIIRLLTISCSGMIAFVIFVNIFPNEVLSLYGQSGEFAEVGILLLRVVTSAMLLLTISVVWLNAVVATGNTKWVLLTEFASILFYLIYTYTVIEKNHASIIIAWLSEWIYWSIMLVLSYLFMKKWLKSNANIRN